jgi:hypothetical protein
VQLGMLDHTEAARLLDEVVEVINCRIDHDLEGWRNCGHFIHEWRPSALMPWLPEAKLLQFENGEAAAIAAVLAGNASLKRERALSPREVFERGRANLVKLPLSSAALFLQEVAVSTDAERPVKQGFLEVQVPEIDPDEPLRFGLMRRDGRGTEEALREGQKYLVRVNPLDTRFAWLYDAKGAFAGVAPFYDRARRDDPKALQRKFAAKRKALAPLIEEGRRLAAPITRAATDRAAANAEVFDRARPVTEAEKEQAAFVREHGAEAAQDILASSQPEPEEQGYGGAEFLKTLSSE